MYGDGNSTKLMKDIMNTLNQVTDGMKESTGIDIASVLSGFAGAKLAEKTTLTVSYIFLRESPLHFTLDNVMIIEALCRIEQSC